MRSNIGCGKEVNLYPGYADIRFYNPERVLYVERVIICNTQTV
jgi:hypothetical protein